MVGKHKQLSGSSIKYYRNKQFKRYVDSINTTNQVR